jgi:transaldolase
MTSSRVAAPAGTRSAVSAGPFIGTEAGIDYDDVVAALERDGVDAFVKSFEKLFDGITGKRSELIRT